MLRQFRVIDDDEQIDVTVLVWLPISVRSVKVYFSLMQGSHDRKSLIQPQLGDHGQ